MRDEVPDLRAREKARIEPVQEEAQLRGLLQLLDGVDGGLEVLRGDDRPVIGEEHRRIAAREAPDRVGHRRIARAVVRQEGGPAELIT